MKILRSNLCGCSDQYNRVKQILALTGQGTNAFVQVQLAEILNLCSETRVRLQTV